MRDAIAGGDAQLRDPQRAQAAVGLGDAGELEDGGRHDWIWRLTSSTMRLDAVRAAISIFDGREVADDRAVGDRRVDDRRQHAGVDAGADDRGRPSSTAIASVPIENTGLRAAAIRR